MNPGSSSPVPNVPRTCVMTSVLVLLDAGQNLDLPQPAPDADDLPAMVEERPLVLHFAGTEQHAVGQCPVDGKSQRRLGRARHGWFPTDEARPVVRRE